MNLEMDLGAGVLGALIALIIIGVDKRVIKRRAATADAPSWTRRGLPGYVMLLVGARIIFTAITTESHHVWYVPVEVFCGAFVAVLAIGYLLISPRKRPTQLED